MTNEQITEQLIKINGEIAEIRASDKSAHKRIDENDRITNGIHEIAASVQTLALQIKLLTERLDENMDELKDGQRRHGERIGAVETFCLSIERLEKSISVLSGKVEAIEKEPATKWKDLVKQVIAIVVAAVVGAVTGKFTK